MTEQAQQEQPEQPKQPQVTRVVLVRHGTNEMMVQGKLAGTAPDVHLNDRGRQEAQAAADRLATEPIKAIYSSPLERAQETARFLVDKLNMPATIVEGIRETGIGEWTMQPIEELAKLDQWKQVQATPSTFRFPGGEAFFEIQTRFVAAVEALRAAHPGEMIALFSHSDPIKLAVAFYLGLPLDFFQRLTINPASITEIVFTPGGARLIRYNDCAHIPPEPEKTAAQEAGAQETGTTETPLAETAAEKAAAQRAAATEQPDQG
jgi:probable phosphomutase (TIGR03848 family)